jgi:hypothetical protein
MIYRRAAYRNGHRIPPCEGLLRESSSVGSRLFQPNIHVPIHRSRLYRTRLDDLTNRNCWQSLLRVIRDRVEPTASRPSPLCRRNWKKIGALGYGHGALSVDGAAQRRDSSSETSSNRTEQNLKIAPFDIALPFTISERSA